MELNGAVDDAIDKMGITNGNIFLAGHSLGGNEIENLNPLVTNGLSNRYQLDVRFHFKGQ